MSDDKKILEKAITECFGADIQIDQGTKLFVSLMVRCNPNTRNKYETEQERDKKYSNAIKFMEKIKKLRDREYQLNWIKACTQTAMSMDADGDIRPYLKGFHYIRRYVS